MDLSDPDIADQAASGIQWTTIYRVLGKTMLMILILIMTMLMMLMKVIMCTVGGMRGLIVFMFE